MKQQMVGYTRRRQWRSRLIGVATVMLFFVLPARAQTDEVLPTIGGSGGANQFVLRCPQNQLLTGFELRVNDDVDALRPICVSVYGPAEMTGPLEPFPSAFGGNRQLVCPTDAPIVIGLRVGADGARTKVVNNIHLFCGQAATTQKLSENPSAVFDGPNAPNHGGIWADFKGDSIERQDCPAGLVAVGVHGRTGYWVDAMGLICGPPKLTPRAEAPIPAAPAPIPKAVGRVKLDPARPAFIYGVASDGSLKWYKHTGAADGSKTWEGPQDVDGGWNRFKQVFAGDNGSLYAITRQGDLLLHRHTAFATGEVGSWQPPQRLARGWGNFKEVFSGGEGVIYAIAPDGILKWYRYLGFAKGAPIWEGPKDVGNGWADFKQVFSEGEGIIYAITKDGKLQWRRHNGYLTGGGYETWEGAKEIGTGWGDFQRVFSAGGGVIYAVAPDGKLMWYRLRNFNKKDNLPVWDGPKVVGGGWDFLQVFAQL